MDFDLAGKVDFDFGNFFSDEKNEPRLRQQQENDSTKKIEISISRQTQRAISLKKSDTQKVYSTSIYNGIGIKKFYALGFQSVIEIESLASDRYSIYILMDDRSSKILKFVKG